MERMVLFLFSLSSTKRAYTALRGTTICVIGLNLIVMKRGAGSVVDVDLEVGLALDAEFFSVSPSVRF
jgi:hypothetical protein